jgi:hypothetical protein
MLQATHIGLDGLGLCDRNSVAGVVRAHLIKREQELTLAYHPGARLVFADGTPDILAYPRDRAAWGRLCRLLTCGNLRAEKGECILYRDDLLEHIDGLELCDGNSTWELLTSPVAKPTSPPLPHRRRSGCPPASTGKVRCGSRAPLPAEVEGKLRLVENEKKAARPKDLALASARAPPRPRAACRQHALSRQ